MVNPNYISDLTMRLRTLEQQVATQANQITQQQKQIDTLTAKVAALEAAD